MRVTPERPVVCMFVRNAFRNDSRVTREALTLIEEGFVVVVFAVVMKAQDAGESWQGPIRVIRVTLPTIVSRVVRLVRVIIGPLHRVRTVTLRILRRASSQDGEPIRVQSQRASAPSASRSDLRQRLYHLLMPAHRFFQGLKFARVAGDRAAALRPVAYHCHDLNSLLAGFRGRKRFRAPVVYDSHELWPHRSRPDPRRRKTLVLEAADRFLSARADAVITVSDSIALHMERRYGLPKVDVVRNVPSLSWRDAPPDLGVWDELPRPRLVYVGGIQPKRGLEEVIDAMPMIDDAVLFSVGSGKQEYIAGLRRRAEARGVLRRVWFLDPVPLEAVIPTIAHGDLGMCLIQPSFLSYRLTLPNKLFEYIHAGVPVLASDFPEWRELVERFDVGGVCDPGDPADIARTINHLLSRPEDLSAMRDNALKSAQELNWEHERARLIGVYRRLGVAGGG